MDDTYSLICKLDRDISTMLKAEMLHNGLGAFYPSHGKIMLALASGKPISMKTLAEIINKKPQTLTSLVTALEDAKYVNVVSCKNDKRSKYVIITEKGMDFIPKLHTVSKKLYTMQYKGFTEEEKTIFRKCLTKMLDNFSDTNL